MVGVFRRNLLKLRITVQPVMQKARVVEPKTQGNFVDSHKSSMGGGKSGGCGLNCLISIYRAKCCKFLTQLWCLPPGLERSSINITIYTNPQARGI